MSRPLTLASRGLGAVLALVVLFAGPIPAALAQTGAGGGEGGGIQLDLDLEELLGEEGATNGDSPQPPDVFDPIESITGGAADQRVVAASGAVLRGLDKVAGQSRDISLAVGETVSFGRLSITLDDCRYPEDEAAAEAYAHLEIIDPHRDGPAFHGWMIASSPALNALDHARFDVWLLRCNNS